MPEMLYSGAGRAAEAVEWRLARPEDGPVWVALTREGRTPLVPREALAEPDQRRARDQQEQRDELARFRAESLEHRGMRFLVWRASRPLGRLCFEARGGQAYLGGIALLPELEPGVVEQVARMAVQRALDTGVWSVRAAYEARHAAAFASAGFREWQRYTVMVAATRQVEEDEEVRTPDPLDPLHQLRPVQPDDAQTLSMLLREAYRDEPDSRERPALSWLTDVTQLLEEPDNQALADCSFIAELRQGLYLPPKEVGAILVSRWQGAALIDELAVAPRYRRRGIGSALLRQAMLGLREHNYASVILVVSQGAPAQQFYRQLGFREAQPSYIEAEYVLKRLPAAEVAPDGVLQVSRDSRVAE